VAGVEGGAHVEENVGQIVKWINYVVETITMYPIISDEKKHIGKKTNNLEIGLK
jgi:hypothetical protein